PAGGVLAHAAGKLREAASAIPQWADRAREAQREQARQELAARLAADLRDGEACPVCGSREHRALHREPLEAEDRGDALLRGWEELNARCQRLQLELSPLQTRAEAAAERLLETLEAGRLEDANAWAANSGAEPERGIAHGSGRAAGSDAGQNADGTAASGAAERLRREAAAAAEAAVAAQAESLAAFAPAGPEPSPAEALD
ncbi:hypothetical protein I8J29_33490, partial [Paenibacillus sp. MWE-103]|nr:hypothetical protein [Paenibacillus artemisiicola]